MARRQIVEIDEKKCDGCGQCVPACAEGAIRIVDGKAKLVADMHCDGLGACLGECPRGAITIIEREADPFDEAAILNHEKTPLPPKAPSACSTGCPGAALRQLPIVSAASAGCATPELGPISQTPTLCHWPIQLHLVPPNAPFLRQVDLFLVADCVPFACADFHGHILKGRPIVIGCPKLDDAGAYVGKLAEMLVASDVKSLTVVHMEVPCCKSMMRIATEAIRRANVDVPVREITIAVPVPRR